MKRPRGVSRAEWMCSWPSCSLEDCPPRDPHRDRQLRSDRGPRRSLLGGADRTLAPEFPHRHRPHADLDRACARHRQARRRTVQPRARPARPAPRQRDHPRRARGDRGQARRSFPAGRVADRLGHPEQHEPQRGHRQPRQRDARRRARRQEAGASQRSRQHEPVVERLLPDRDAHRGRKPRSPPISSLRSASCSARCARRRRSSPRSSRSAAPTPRTRRR